MRFKFGFCWFCLFLFAVLAVSGEEIITKYVCPGDSVQAFQNIRFNKCSSVVSLYINGEEKTLIARWSFENFSQIETFFSDYNDRVFLYSNGTVWILNVHPWDQAKYIINCQMGNISMEDVVQIIVMAAPANDCILQILHHGSSLFVRLKAHSCGEPVATVYWKRKGYDFLSKTQEPVLKLNPGNQDGTYYACIEGPALTCVRNALDYCSNFTIGDESPPVLLQTWDIKMVIVIVAGIVSGVSVILVIVGILIKKRCRQNIVKQNLLLKKENELCVNQFDQTHRSRKTHQAAYYTPLKLSTTSTLLKGAVENRRDNGNVLVTSGENERRTDVREVKDQISVPGSSRAFSRPDDQSDIVKQNLRLKKENELCVNQFDQTHLSRKTHQAAYYTPLKLSYFEKSQQKQSLTTKQSQETDTMREKQMRE